MMPNQDKCKNNGLTGLKLIGMTIMAHNVFTVPATLDLLYGVVRILYFIKSTDLLASVRSLCSRKSLKQHDCIFFSHGDFLNRDW